MFYSDFTPCFLYNISVAPHTVFSFVFTFILISSNTPTETLIKCLLLGCLYLLVPHVVV